MPRPSSLFLAALVALLLSGCAVPLTSPPAPSTSEAPMPAGTAVAISRSACYGLCPVYEASVTAEGAVTFNGIAHVAHVGLAQSTIDPASVRRLIDASQDAGFFALPDSIGADRSDPAGLCADLMTDQPTVELEVFIESASKRVVHYLGCEGFEGAASLAALEGLVDDVLGVQQWISGE